MQSLQNDFVVFKGPLELSAHQVSLICDRQTGIGADGVLTVTAQTDETIEMNYWNSDGSKAEMCGNGLRCVAMFAVDNQLTKSNKFPVKVPTGQLNVEVDLSGESTVKAQIGVVADKHRIINLYGYKLHILDVGNPHAVAFVDDIESVQLQSVGPKIENDTYFPNRTNVEFIEILEDSIKFRVWERGSGETKACGTGIVAAAVLAHNQGKVRLPATVRAPGGDALVWTDKMGYACMQAPVETVSTGSLNL